MSDDTWPDVLSALVAGRDLDADSATVGDGGDPDRRGDTRADRRLRRRAAGQGRDGRRGRGPGRRPCTRTRRRSTYAGRAVDIVGTGGDRAHTVNISTMAAVVIAGAGVPRGQARQPRGVVVVRRRRRARGARRAARPAAGPGRPRCCDEVGHHVLLRAGVPPALRHAAVPRRELGVPTTFNFLGPLANPARPAARRSGSPTCGWRRSWPACSAARGVDALRVPRRRRARRAHDDARRRACGDRRRATVTSRTRSTRASSASLRAGVRRPARVATRRSTPTSFGGVLGGEAGAGARRRRCSTPARRIAAATTGAAAAELEPDVRGAGMARAADVARLRGGRQGSRWRALGRGRRPSCRAPGRRSCSSADARRLPRGRAGSSAERDVGLGRQDARHLVELVGDDVGDVVVAARTRTIAIRSMSPVTE